MRKSEFIHLHALFVELRWYLGESGPVPVGAFTAYDEYNVGPTEIHRRKAQHHEAVSRLRSGVQRTIEVREQTVTEPPMSAPTANADSITH
ncbi:UPF0058 family protein [Haloterrigena gelatinilytica]